MAEAFSLPFMQRALLGGLLAGAVCSFLAVYIVLRRIVFVGVALAQLSSAGVALGFMLGGAPVLLSVLPFGLVLMGVAALATLQTAGTRLKLPQEGLIGATYATALAATVLLVAKSPQGEMHILELLTGNILAITPGDIALGLAIFVPVAIAHGLFFKEIVFTSFDRETASALGLKVGLWDAVFYISLGAAIAATIRLVGVLLGFAYLVLPGVVALMVAKGLRGAFPVAVASGVVPTFVGLCLSYIWDLPSGPTVAACIAGVLIPAWIWSRLRG